MHGASGWLKRLPSGEPGKSVRWVNRGVFYLFLDTRAEPIGQAYPWMNAPRPWSCMLSALSQPLNIPSIETPAGERTARTARVASFTGLVLPGRACAVGCAAADSSGNFPFAGARCRSCWSMSPRALFRRRFPRLLDRGAIPEGPKKRCKRSHGCSLSACWPGRASRCSAGPTRPAARPVRGAGRPPAGRVVYLGRGLSDESLITLGAAVAARPGAVLLLDSPPLTPYLRHFLTAYRPDRVIPVGVLHRQQGRPGAAAGRARRCTPSPGRPARRANCGRSSFPPPRASWCVRLGRAPGCSAPPAWQARCGVPLWVSGNQPAETAILRRWLQLLGNARSRRRRDARPGATSKAPAGAWCGCR